MLIPVMPAWMLYVCGLSSAETGLAMGIFALGLFLPGGFCSWLVQRYRRNQVCVWSMLLLAAAVAAPAWLGRMSFPVVLALRLVQGGAFGLSLMVLTSTLVIDASDSSHRTEANYSATWFSRFALSLGPLAALIITTITSRHSGLEGLFAHLAAHSSQFVSFPVFLLAAACSVVAAVLILLVHFPFRTPSDHVSLFSRDRFLLVEGWPLMLNLLPVMVAVGMLFTLPLDAPFYALLMVGFLLALLAQRFVFPDAELKSEAVTALLLIAAGILALLNSPLSTLHSPLSTLHSPLISPLIGLGLGLLGSRFLLFFIKLSHHCQRGTAQSTFLLMWECGLALGLGLGYFAFADSPSRLLVVALVLVVLSLVAYVLFVHRWFEQHRMR